MTGPRVPPDQDRTAIAAAWHALLDVTPAGWEVAQPSYHIERDDWQLYAWDTTVRARVGKRSREWTVVATTEVGVVMEMARCLQEISDGRVPT